MQTNKNAGEVRRSRDLSSCRVNMAACGAWEDNEGTNTKRLSHPLHANSLLSALNENRKLPNFCDGVVCVSGEEIPVQKNILAATSPYFRLVPSR